MVSRPVAVFDCPVPGHVNHHVGWCGFVLPQGAIAAASLAMHRPVTLLAHGAAALLFAVLRRSASRITIGDDGILFRRWGAKSFLEFDRIATWRAGGTGGRSPDVGDHAISFLSIVDRDGRRWRIVLVCDDWTCVRIADALAIRLNDWRAQPAPAAAVRELPYRQVAVTIDTGLEVVANPRAAPEARLAALASLRSGLDEAARQRLWAIACGTANPRLREAFGRAYHATTWRDRAMTH